MGRRSSSASASDAPHPPPKVTARAWTIEQAVDGTFFVVAGILVVWLGWLLLAKNLGWSWRPVASLVVFWALVAYLGLPRLQQVLAGIYVPDYFVGRTVTTSGILGDPVNLALDGSEAQLHGAMLRGGWIRADEVTVRSSWGIIVSAVFKRPYPAAPVSPLLLFDRREAFAYEQEVAGNASQRHHVRFWPTPEGWVLPGGHRVGWLAAGTYDRKVGLSLFTLQVTHKVDADIDAERDHVVATLQAADAAVHVQRLESVFSAFHARNGGGDIVQTDGDLPIVDLTGVAPAPAPRDAHVTATSRVLPPTMLLAAGALSATKAGATLISLVLFALGADRARLFPGASVAQLAQVGGSAAALVVLWSLTLTRRRWARTLLMAVCTADTVGQLLSLSNTASGHASLAVVLSAGLSVLVLIAVSADDARRWVHG